MIGPHEGKELALMLAGKKYLAAFGDVLPDDGVIAEAIIPQQAFAPYVANGTFRRFEQSIFSIRLNKTLRHVCFTSPGHEWRAETFLWIRRMSHAGQMPVDKAADIIIGRLLGYDEADIQDFIQHSSKRISSTQTANSENNQISIFPQAAAQV